MLEYLQIIRIFGDKSMAQYHTEQRKKLHEFFCSHPHEYFTVKEIHSFLADQGISLSAIYRNLASMKEEGVVRCQINKDSRDLLYRFIDKEHCANSIHLTCMGCGKVFHMDAESERKMQAALSAAEGFNINKEKTVLYGTCKKCQA